MHFCDPARLTFALARRGAAQGGNITKNSVLSNGCREVVGRRGRAGIDFSRAHRLSRQFTPPSSQYAALSRVCGHPLSAGRPPANEPDPRFVLANARFAGGSRDIVTR